MTKSASRRKIRERKRLEVLQRSRAAAERQHNPSKYPMARLLDSMPTAERHAFKAKRRVFRNLHRACVKRIYRRIIGTAVPFPGTIVIPSPEEARLLDAERVKDLEGYGMWWDRNRVFWTDGSVFESGSKAGLMGAAVAYFKTNADTQRPQLTAERFCLGKDVGDAADAEIFAIAATLRMAVDDVRAGKGSLGIKSVRVFSDAKEILKRLADGRHTDLGTLHDHRFAIQDLFERALWLEEQGVSVELVWVKGHRSSAGNKEADSAASAAVTVQERARCAKADALLRAGFTPPQQQERANMPEGLEGARRDWVDVWKWRMSRTWLLTGNGVCYMEDEESEAEGDEMREGGESGEDDELEEGEGNEEGDGR